MTITTTTITITTTAPTTPHERMWVSGSGKREGNEGGAAGLLLGLALAARRRRHTA